MKPSLLITLGLFFLFSCNSSSKNNSISEQAKQLKHEIFYPIDSLKNQEVKNKLRKIRSTIESKNWNSFISFCDSANYYAQTEDLGMNDDQYIYEILNIKLETKGDYTQHNHQVLSSIFEATFVDYSYLNNYYLFRGVIVTYKKQKIPFFIQLRKENDNDLRIIGGWG